MLIATFASPTHNGIVLNNFQGDLNNLANSLNLEGKISRIGMVPGIFYVVENTNLRTYGIDLGKLEGYRGETFSEIGVKVGATVRFRTGEDPRIVASASVIR